MDKIEAMETEPMTRRSRYTLRRKLMVGGLIGGAAVAAFALFLSSGGEFDAKKVTIGFHHYEETNGVVTAVFYVTNGSSQRISAPDGNYTIKGETPDGAQTHGTRGVYTSCGGFIVDKWWQWRIPKVPNIPPGGIERVEMSPPEPEFTWNVTASFRVIPLRERLPYILQQRLPRRSPPKYKTFQVTSSAVPPRLDALETGARKDKTRTPEATLEPAAPLSSFR